MNPWGHEDLIFHATSASLPVEGICQDHGYALTNILRNEAVIRVPRAQRIDGQLWMFSNAGNMRRQSAGRRVPGTIPIVRSDEADGFA